MRTRKRVGLLGMITIVALLGLATAPGGSGPESNGGTSVDLAPKAPVATTYGQLPLHFEPNQGQIDAQVKFVARGRGYTVFLTATEAVLALYIPTASPKIPHVEDIQVPRQSVLHMQLVGANPDPKVTGVEELPGKANYFLGNAPTSWRTNISTYAKVRYEAVYPGVDLVYYGHQRQLEYDFVVAPGADPKAIRLAFEGADRLEVEAQDNVILHIADRQLRLHKPFIYQEITGGRQEISGGYVLTNTHQVGFYVAAYDSSKPLVIDPVLSYSTYLGGSGSDAGFGTAVDTAGNAYVTGQTTSANFPTTSGAFQTIFGGGSDAFVTKLNAAGSALVYTTYLGGNGSNDGGFAIAVDGAGNIYVGGQTNSTNFPTTPGAFQTGFAGGGGDAFVAKLNATGDALLYSTYLGGGSSGGPLCCGAVDGINGLVIDSSGNAYVVTTKFASY